MKQKEQERTAAVYWELWRSCQTDPEYARLLAELEALEPVYQGIFSTLPRESQEVLDRYITLREHMGRRMLEYACQHFEKFREA